MSTIDLTEGCATSCGKVLERLVVGAASALNAGDAHEEMAGLGVFGDEVKEALVLAGGAGHSDHPDCPPHHWRIETPSGPTCLGTCIRCGLEKRFDTTIDQAVLMRLSVVARDG